MPNPPQVHTEQHSRATAWQLTLPVTQRCNAATVQAGLHNDVQGHSVSACLPMCRYSAICMSLWQAQALGVQPQSAGHLVSCAERHAGVSRAFSMGKQVRSALRMLCMLPIVQCIQSLLQQCNIAACNARSPVELCTVMSLASQYAINDHLPRSTVCLLF